MNIVHFFVVQMREKVCALATAHQPASKQKKNHCIHILRGICGWGKVGNHNIEWMKSPQHKSQRTDATNETEIWLILWVVLALDFWLFLRPISDSRNKWMIELLMNCRVLSLIMEAYWWICDTWQTIQCTWNTENGCWRSKCKRKHQKLFEHPHMAVPTLVPLPKPFEIPRSELNAVTISHPNSLQNQ